MKIKELFSTPKRTVVSVICMVAILGILGTGSAFAVGAIARQNAIGEDTAEFYAYADAGVDPETVEISESRFCYHEGQFAYEIDFASSGKTYKYFVKASDGRIIEKETQRTGAGEVNKTTEDVQLIGEEKALDIALKDAGLKETEVSGKRVNLDKDDGVQMYEVEFYTDKAEYEYDVEAVTGEILYKAVEEHEVGTEETQNPEAENIGKAKAKKIALDDAGLKESEVTFTKTKLDNDDGREIYDVEFHTEKKEYEYEIDAKTGKIVNKSVENRENDNNNNNNNTDTDTQLIGKTKAKKIALDDAGLKESEVTFTEVYLDRDDGVQYYNVDFYTSTKEYDYEIHAVSGKILERDIENRDDNNNNNNDSTDTQLISKSKAKKIALDDAGLKESEVTFTSVYLERDDGVQYYNVDFYTSTTEYDYEIHAVSGKILERDAERREVHDDDDDHVNNPGQYIGVDAAKAAALKHAGLSANEVTFTKAKLEKDDGRVVYEIEFYANGVEYEYEIDAETGKVISYDSERDDD